MSGITRWEVVGSKRSGLGARYRMLLRVGSAEVGGLIEVVEFAATPTSPGRRSPASTSAAAGACAAGNDGRSTVTTLRLSYGVAGAGHLGLARRAASPPRRSAATCAARCSSSSARSSTSSCAPRPPSARRSRMGARLGRPSCLGAVEGGDGQRRGALLAPDEAHPLPGRELTFDAAEPARPPASRGSRRGEGASLGRSSITVASTWATAQPAPATRGERPRAAGPSSRRRASCSSVSGKCWPMSPRPAAPSSASTIAWVRTSASEWPARPALAAGSRRRRGSAAARRRSGGCRCRCRCASQPIGSSRRSRPSNTHSSLIPTCSSSSSASS